RAPVDRRRRSGELRVGPSKLGPYFRASRRVDPSVTSVISTTSAEIFVTLKRGVSASPSFATKNWPSAEMNAVSAGPSGPASWARPTSLNGDGGGAATGAGATMAGVAAGGGAGSGRAWKLKRLRPG